MSPRKETKSSTRTRSRRGSRKTGLPVLTLRDVVVFPGMVAPLYVGRARSIEAVEAAMGKDKRILLVTQLKPETDDPKPPDLFEIGCIAEILQLLKLPDGNLKILAEGHKRARLGEDWEEDEYLRVDAIPFDTHPTPMAELEAWKRLIVEQFERYVKLSRRIPQETLYTVVSLESVERLVDQVAAHVDSKVGDKQSILASASLEKRCQILSGILQEEIEILNLEHKLKGEVRSQMEKTQREYYLNEQMKAIQRELGRGGENAEEVEELEKRIREAGMSPQAEEKALRELDRLANMPPMSPEATVVRGFLEWMSEVPWSKRSDDNGDIAHAQEILEEDHYGLEKPKERILEFLAARQLAGEDTKMPILCFVGPPGVGKTSLGQSIARSLGRQFVRISLGGVRDEAEIRGHRRTYIGSMPGRIIQYMRRAGTRNPVFLLDEVDKMSMDFRGDPSAALLEVLDPELNHSFSDHYLEVDYDLSEVFFITTANVLHTIPAALRDRMEIIHIPSYTEHEKVQIAQQYLVPKQIKANGLLKKKVEFSEEGLRTLIRNYTREAGVRNLEREIGSVCRKIAKEITLNKSRKRKFRVTPQLVRKSLGVPRYQRARHLIEERVGLSTGLSWTEVGGEVLTIEASTMAGKGVLTLTGQLGDVMQESARAAITWARSNAGDLEIDPEFHGKTDIHIHVPEGAIPKDGPSAGITLATAVISALTSKPARKDVAMTGELTLSGRVLPVGGIKEKVLAAHREGIMEVILPEENQKDLEEIPETISEQMSFNFVKDMQGVLKIAFGERKAAQRVSKGRKPAGKKKAAATTKKGKASGDTAGAGAGA